MTKVDFLIIGGGIAGTTAAEEIRFKDPNASITLLTEEDERLYSRVLLPHYLRNENTLETLFLRKKEVYQQKNIELLTSVKALRIEPETKTVTTSDGQTFSYDKLLIATGGKANKLLIPGGDLPEIVYLRTLEDAKKIKEIMAKSKTAVVLGGGFIGIDLIQSFIKNGLQTTAIIRENFFWENMVGENSGKFLSQLLANNGVEIITKTQVTEFSGTAKLEGVKIDKSSLIKCDIAGLGIGIHLDLDYLKDSGLATKKGIVTNEYLETSIPGVWAAGDIAEFYDPIFKKYHTLGNWANSSSQGRTAGINMSGEKQAFETTGMYSVNIFNTNLAFLGDPVVDENTELIERGSVADGKLGRLLIRDGVIAGVSLINLPIDRSALTSLIRNKTKITAAKSKLSDLSFDLSTIH